MRKVISILLAVIMVFGSICVVSAYDLSEEFEMSSSGEITLYYGDRNVYIPEEINGVKVKKIGKQTFMDLGIESVYITSMEEIGESAFEGSSVLTVDIPENLTKIGKSAFMNCESLTQFFIGSKDGSIVFGQDAFKNTPYIKFYAYCTADKELLSKKIRTAKGNDSFDIFTLHYNVADGYITMGDNQIPASKCADCGSLELFYPGYLGHPFTDVSDSKWYAEYVDAAYNTGIINGKAQNRFDPDATMTCAEAAKIAASIHALLHENNISKPESDAWYVPYVDYCYNYEIIEEGVNFNWNQPISRGQMAYMFSRADTSDYYINDVPLGDIPDVDRNTLFVDEILELYNRGIAVGDENMNYKPYSNIKRSEVSAIISRILFYDMRVELAKG